MRKLLITSLFILGTIGTMASQSTNQATMNITATIIKPLKIREKTPMNFGNMTNGERRQATGVFEVDGESGADIEIEFPDKTELRREHGNQSIEVALSTASNKVTIGTDGKVDIPIIGDINVGDDGKVPQGNYKGSFVAKVRYN
ncbi:MAG: DUF4402 domain-containing protein [Anaeroplasmataceae bacterium]